MKISSFCRGARAALAALALAAALAVGAPAPVAAASAAADAAQAAQAGPLAHRGRALVIALVRATAELTGVEPAAVRDALRGGQSLAEFAAANGSSGEAVVALVVEKARARLDKAVEEGRITAAQAERAIQRLTERAAELVADPELG